MKRDTSRNEAPSVCDLLRKIARLNLQTPVTLVLDNARYQRAKIVQDVAAALAALELPILP